MDPQVETKPLGKTGMSISALALGTWQYRGGVKPLPEGIELGATFIDTAESYETEEVVGQAIQGIRDGVFVATKASPRHFRRGDLIRAAEQSLKRLNTNYIDLYQLHWPNYTVPIEETMSAMEQLVTSGKVRFVGLSNFSAGEFEQAQSCLASSLIVSDQVRYSLVDRTNRRSTITVLPVEADRDISFQSSRYWNPKSAHVRPARCVRPSRSPSREDSGAGRAELVPLSGSRNRRLQSEYGRARSGKLRCSGMALEFRATEGLEPSAVPSTPSHRAIGSPNGKRNPAEGWAQPLSHDHRLLAPTSR